MRKPHLAPKRINKPPSVQPAGGKVQAEKHTEIKTDRGTFKFREPKSADWK